MVSESVTQAAISTKLTAVTVPVVNGEPFVSDELGMTGAGSNQGALVSQSSIDITAAGAAHPLGASLPPGNVVTATSASISNGWGIPAASAVIAATIAGDATKATVFGYETGATMTSGTAPARRVGFFYSGGSSAGLNSASASLFDSSVQWAAQAGPTVQYVRDAGDRIVTRKINGAATEKYVYTASADAPSITLNAAGTVTERTVSLPGGVLVTKRGTTATDVWSYPNIHGDVVATTNGSGVKAGPTRAYDPFGNPLGVSAVPDNSAGTLDYGWHGSQQRPLEHTTGYANLIEMGARQYSPTLGRFLEVDPVPGGVDNSYDHPPDPMNGTDLDGNRRKSRTRQMRPVVSKVLGRKVLRAPGTGCREVPGVLLGCLDKVRFEYTVKMVHQIGSLTETYTARIRVTAYMSSGAFSIPLPGTGSGPDLTQGPSMPVERRWCSTSQVGAGTNYHESNGGMSATVRSIDLCALAQREIA